MHDRWGDDRMAALLAAGAIALLVEKSGARGHVACKTALRDGAGPACVATTTSAACPTGVTEPPGPNFVVGHGVLKARASLALTPGPPGGPMVSACDHVP